MSCKVSEEMKDIEMNDIELNESAAAEETNGMAADEAAKTERCV